MPNSDKDFFTSYDKTGTTTLIILPAVHVWLCVRERFPHHYISWFTMLSWISLSIKRVELLQSGMLRTALCQLWEQWPLKDTFIKIYSPHLLSSLADLSPPTKVTLWQHHVSWYLKKHSIFTYTHTLTHTDKLTLGPAAPGTPGTPWLIKSNTYERYNT